MDQEAPIGVGCFMHSSDPMRSPNTNTLSGGRELSIGIHHLEPLVDRLDVCDCPNHAR